MVNLTHRVVSGSPCPESLDRALSQESLRTYSRSRAILTMGGLQKKKGSHGGLLDFRLKERRLWGSLQKLE